MIVDGDKAPLVSLTEQFEECAKREKTDDGRVWAAQLERLRAYHRERGNLGHRYVEVIRAFNPNYTPYTEEDLVQMSRSIPCLAIT